MIHRKKALDTSSELHLYRYNNGIKLIEPGKSPQKRLTPFAHATHFSVAKRTVEQHLINMKIKMNVSSKADLINKVIDEFIVGL